MEEEQEIARSIELAELVKPRIENGLDLTLFTQTENDLMKKSWKDHHQIFRRRAEELRFYPDSLNEKEESAILRCMTYQELKYFYRIVAIQEKNRRLQNALAIEKVDIRRYCRMTLQFSKSDCGDTKQIPDISIARNTERYFAIMQKNGERTYEKPYYFFTDEHREKVLKIYAKSISEEPNVETMGGVSQ
jgi:hypothetical protein